MNGSEPQGGGLAIDRGAIVRRVSLDATSWVDVVGEFVRDPGEEFRALRETVHWRQTEVLRYDRYIGERRLSAGLRTKDTALLRQTSLHLASRYLVELAGVGAILYRDGEDFQGLHSDRAMRWLDETLVAIVVLGERRPFVLRKRAPLRDVIDRIPAGSLETDVVLSPGVGDLIVMGGAAQRDWLHCVPAFDTPNARISLTWRWSSRRGKPDLNPTYYDGRHFSDGPRRPGTRRTAG